jgi:hypothetical protein
MKMNKDEFRRLEVRGKIAEVRAGGPGAYWFSPLQSDL